MPFGDARKKEVDSGTRRGFDVQIKPVRTINYPREGGREGKRRETKEKERVS